jgi:lysophospholipase L1-like esterase
MFLQIRATLLGCAALLFTGAAQGEILVKSGEKVAFLGDSITAAGWSNPTGYVRLVIAGLKANGIQAEAIPAGISGHKSNQMLARLQKDVLDKKPQWMTLSCGVNDVWHGERGVPLDDAQAGSRTYEAREGEPAKGTYSKNIMAIIDRAQAAGVKPVILTATVIQEDLKSDPNTQLAPYNDFLRKLAAERKLPIADLYALFAERLTAENQPAQKVLTTDGVHMNAEGNKLMATGVLKAFGLDAAQLKKAEAAWAEIPPAPQKVRPATPKLAPTPASPAGAAK